MLHLVQRTVTPHISLKESINQWFGISKFLRESPRKRGLKIEKIEQKALLS